MKWVLIKDDPNRGIGLIIKNMVGAVEILVIDSNVARGIKQFTIMNYLTIF